MLQPDLARCRFLSKGWSKWCNPEAIRMCWNYGVELNENWGTENTRIRGIVSGSKFKSKRAYVLASATCMESCRMLSKYDAREEAHNDRGVLETTEERNHDLTKCRRFFRIRNLRSTGVEISQAPMPHVQRPQCRSALQMHRRRMHAKDREA